MPLETNLNTSPYFDDYDATKDYYRILFQPSVAVQTRELNQLQTLLQQQVERFGNHIFKNGTIINGCNFQYFPIYPYVKILDLQVDGAPVDVTAYDNYFVKTSANLTAKVLKTEPGFQSTNPDLNTLYVRYTNSGTGGEGQFANDDVLTVFSQDYPVFAVRVNNGGTGGLSNSDSVQIVSAIKVDVSTGTFSNNETIIQATTNAHAVIIGISNTDVVSTKILKIRPVTSQLTNTALTAAQWTFSTGYNVVGQTSSAAANTTEIIGSGAQAVVVTDSLGIVKRVDVTGGGSDYTTIPFVTIKPTSNSGAAAASVAQLVLTPENYLAQVTVANSSFTAPVGNGYAFGVTDGFIYQKGHFLRTDPQTIVVSKYNSFPSNVVVSFVTTEEIVSSTSDESLLDNATGAPNENAPGANRLKLVPVLAVNATADIAGNTDFLALVEFVDGMPYKENRETVYSGLAHEFEARTEDSAGDFVLDPFVTTTTELTGAANTTYFLVVADPGKAYIGGKKTETLFNTKIPVQRGNATRAINNQVITMNLGQYVRVDELKGNFRFKVGDAVTFYDAARDAVSGMVGISGQGNAIGTARIRGLAYESGEPGSPNAVYRLYLFDIAMNAGKNFRDVRGVFYNDVTASNYDGIADIVLETVNGTQGAVLQDMGYDSLIFPTGLQATVDVSNNATLYYRTSKEDNTIQTNGQATVTIVASNEYFPYTASANLTSTQEQEVIVVPVANLEMSANLTGTVVNGSNSTLAFLTGTATTFSTDFAVGDYVKVQNTTPASVIRRVVAVGNNTHLVLDANTGVGALGTGMTVKRFYPEFVPIPTASRTNRYANLDATGKILTLNFGETFAAQANCVVFYNVRREASTQASKTIRRNARVRLDLVSAAGYTDGPWTLGLPDACRLRSVKVATAALTNTAAWVDGSNATHGILTGTGTLANTELTVGDYVVVSNATHNIVRSVTSLPSNTSVVLDSLTLPTGTITNVREFYSTTATDITKHFFIDNGHTEDIYGLSKLVKRPGAPQVLTSDQYLIVELDVWEKSGEGYTTVKSYAINDTLTLAASSNTVNTLELPEFQGAKDYYDLRDCIDFRPVATATANLALNANGSANIFLMTTNPSNTVAFSATDKYFPVPDSLFTYNATQCLPRIDRLSISRDGQFQLIAGTPSATPRAPAGGGGGMDIATISVAAYPSIPQNPSAETVKIMGRRIGSNLREVDVRSQTYVNKVLGVDSARLTQVSGYTMADIANLERRISTLEEQATLTALENAVTGIKIKSSLDTTITRYTNGFLADPLQSYDMADMSNPEYRAYIDTEEGSLWPQVGQVALRCEWDRSHANTVAAFVDSNDDNIEMTTCLLPFTEVTLINQDIATVYVPPPPPPPVYYTGSMTASPASFPIRGRIEIVVPAPAAPPVQPPPPPPMYTPPVIVYPAPAPLPPPTPPALPVVQWHSKTIGGWGGDGGQPSICYGTEIGTGLPVVSYDEYATWTYAPYDWGSSYGGVTGGGN